MIASLCTLSQRHSFIRYSLEDGLPQIQCKALLQDKNDYLWIATWGGGLARFDGKSFKVYNHHNGLPKTSILDLEEDQSGNIWIAIEGGGVTRFDGNSFTSYNKSSGLTNERVLCIYASSDNKIWVGTEQGLNVVTKQGETYIVNNTNVPRILKNKSINSIAKNKLNELLIGTSEGLYLLSQGNIITKYDESNGLSSDYITTLFKDNLGNLFVGTNNGISILREDTFETFQLPKSNFTNYSINSITQNEKGEIWVATYGQGIYILSSIGNTYKLEKYLSINEGLSSNNIWDIIEDSEGNMWLGSDIGLNKYSGQTFTNITKEFGLPDNNVWVINQDVNHHLWFGTETGLSVYDGESIETINIPGVKGDYWVRALHIDKNNVKWFGIIGGGFYCLENGKYKQFGEEAGLTDNSVYEIFEDSKGILWLSTNSGLFKFNGKSFVNFTMENGLTDNRVRGVTEDHNGAIWVGSYHGVCKILNDTVRAIPELNSKGMTYAASITTDHEGRVWGSLENFGLFVYDHHKFSFIEEKEGLTSSIIYILETDSEGNLWIGSNQGLDALNIEQFFKKDTVIVKHFGYNDGFTGIECASNASFKDNEGNLWFGTIGGAFKFNSKEQKINKKESTTLIESITLMDADTNLANGSILTYNLDNIAFTINGICFTSPEKVRFKYYLEGYETAYGIPTTNRYAQYTNLDPGEYTFKVISCNNEGIWNAAPTTFSFSITPPFWNTWWFYVLVFSFILFSIWFYVQARTKNLVALKEKLQKMVEARTHELQEKNEELEKLSIVAREVDNGIVITDAKGIVQWTNEGYARLHGYFLKERIPQPGHHITEYTDNSEMNELLNNCIESGKSQIYESKNLNAEEKFVWVQTTVTPIKNEAGEITKLVFLDSDITERKLQEDIIEQKNQDILDSITYAKRIQHAMLPSPRRFSTIFPNAFVLYKPKDIVSGDFYYIEKKNNKTILAAIDCTGHGVPGAFMSMIGIDLLNHIILEKGQTDPGKILTELDKGLKKALHKKDTIKTKTETMDGMDASICVIDNSSMKMQYAGAFNPVYIIPKNTDSKRFEIPYCIPFYNEDGNANGYEIKADKYPIGGLYLEEDRKYTTREIQLEKEDKVYVFSDGYIDQFGGESGKKFMSKRFKQLLLSSSKKGMHAQKQHIDKTLNEWKGNFHQIDDICVVGVEI